MMLKNLFRAAVLIAVTQAASAQDSVTLRLHQPISAQATIPSQLLRPWAAEIEQESGGRLKIEFYDAMALGGKPADLYDQARDGAVDIALMLPGYTPGRFPRSEVFELPFIVKDTVAASQALMTMIVEDLAASEFRDVRVLAAWVHGPGVLHTNRPIGTLDDLDGLQIRAPGRLAGQLLTTLGAGVVGMPLPAVPENLMKGVINGALVPWDVAASIKLTELVHFHTEFGEGEAIYTAELLLVMNPDAYAALPDDLRAILDRHSGLALSERAARIQVGGDAPNRAIALTHGNTVTVLVAAEVARWKAAAAPVRDAWIADMTTQGIDGAALISRAQTLMAQFGG
jgi:TRAP-type transport system periplasmic protein